MNDKGWETPFGDLEVRAMVASDDTLVVVGATADVVIEARSARWDGERFVDLRRMEVPHDPDCDTVERPSLSLDQRGGKLNLAINLEESQGGSWGVVVIPDLTHGRCETIENPTGESDIGFADTLLLRGDTLLTRGPWELRRFARSAAGHWSEEQTLPAGGDSSFEWSWSMALSPAGTTWMAARWIEGPRLEIMELRRGTFEPALVLPMEKLLQHVAFVNDDEALVCSSYPWSDGKSLRLVQRTGAGWAWGRAYPAPLDPDTWDIRLVAVRGRQALIAQSRKNSAMKGSATRDPSAWWLDLNTGRLTLLELPPRDEVHLCLMGPRTVIRVGNQIKVVEPGALAGHLVGLALGREEGLLQQTLLYAENGKYWAKPDCSMGLLLKEGPPEESFGVTYRDPG